MLALEMSACSTSSPPYTLVSRSPSGSRPTWPPTSRRRRLRRSQPPVRRPARRVEAREVPARRVEARPGRPGHSLTGGLWRRQSDFVESRY